MIDYKTLILEALKEQDTFSKFALLHDSFLNRLKNSCASYTKVKDTFSDSKLKDSWYREYHFECAENNTIVVQLTNERKSKTDYDYGKWNIKCLCDVGLGELVFSDDVAKRFLEIVANSKSDQLLEHLEALCNQFSHSSETITNDQSFDQLVNTLTTTYHAKANNQSIVFKIDNVTISLFNNTTHWEVRGAFDIIDFGFVELNENTADDIEDYMSKLAFNMPQTLLTRLVDKNKNAKPDYIKNDN